MNAARGETGLAIGGVERKLCLTLGALAEIEANTQVFVGDKVKVHLLPN